MYPCQMLKALQWLLTLLMLHKPDDALVLHGMQSAVKCNLRMQSAIKYYWGSHVLHGS
jgi:hypothetical protein